MDEKKYFVEQIDKLLKFGRNNGNVVTEENVKNYFEKINLSDEQIQLVYNFLYDAKIGVGEPIDADENLEDEDRDFLEMYLSELSELENYTQKKKFEIIEKFLNGDESLKGKLIESYLKDVVDMAKLYAGAGVTIEDLIGEGNVALACIIEALDPSQSPKETDGFITESIMSAMEEMMYEDNNEKQKGDNWAEDANDVLDKAKELAETLGRNVHIAELCQFGDFEEEFVKKVLELTGGIDIIEE